MPGWRERLRLHRLELTVGHQAYKFAAAAAPPLLLTSCVLWFVSCHPRTVFCFFGERQCCFANESVVLRTKVCPFLRQQEWARCEHRRAPPRAWRTHRFLQMHVDRAGYLPSFLVACLFPRALVFFSFIAVQQPLASRGSHAASSHAASVGQAEGAVLSGGTSFHPPNSRLCFLPPVSTPVPPPVASVAGGGGVAVAGVVVA